MNSKCETCLFFGLCKAADLEYCEGESYVEGTDRKNRRMDYLGKRLTEADRRVEKAEKERDDIIIMMDRERRKWANFNR
jgi:hypothetical protein